MNNANESFLGSLAGVTAAKVLTDTAGDMSLAKVYQMLQKFNDASNTTLPGYIKRATVDSRVFISKEAAMEEVINDVLYCDNMLYVGWVTAAMSMSQFVHGTRVRDLLSVVATEHLYKDKDINFTDSIINNIKIDSISIPPNLYVKASNEDLVDDVKNTIDDAYDYLNVKNDKKNKINTAGANVMEGPRNFNLLAGVIINLDLSVGGKDSRQRISIPLLVRLNPTIIKDDLAKSFFKLNYKPDFWMRWFKVKTGEISFWKDFLFELDLRDEKKNALRQDKYGELMDMELQRTNSLTAYLGKILQWRPERQNIASTIHIYTKRQFDEWCHSVGINFNNDSDRAKFFAKSFSVMVNVIDSDYNKLYCYVAGINSRAEYSFSQIQNQANKQQYDLASIMRAFSSQNSPRF